MNIRKASILEIRIPFRFTFRHALAARNKGTGILVRLEDDEGRVGWGESAPRKYVTGETTETASEALATSLLPTAMQVGWGSFAEAQEAIRSWLHDLPRDQHAAFCALELATLDLAGKAYDQTAGSIVGELAHPRLAFSGIISADGAEAARKACELVGSFGFRQVKLKVGVSHDTDMEILRSAREALGPDVGLRVDANCAWTAEQALENINDLASFGLQGIEQPLAGNDLEGLTWLTERSPVPIIVDESLASLADADELIERKACHAFNIRISKCGGLLNSVRIRDRARQAGIGCMLGAQVGEAALLSAAGRHFAARSTDLMFLEGSYGTILLDADIGTRDLTIGPGGEAEALDGAGLGVEVDEQALAPFISARHDIGDQ